ncbi:enoyl-CoA hydratase/isomerase family protein [Roseisalinus antarcticus]|uniref:3-hydroxyisobutyryl-CoA hydrolase n=1 Tax=Roseisalinus antarcticus TaxID=254357 RepID=A0A1Y5RHJ8_9RHOB|nr:enoyl-CoA hydratase/isomerase family protein [Roseisalinus antarcticus]SLN17495.1 2,3-dehydroadipyl-CoA hydratase [Roseisalinus antarcticus]
MTDEILIRRDGHAGRITLNRPAALNALTHGMCRAIEAALTGWAKDRAIALLIIDGAPGRAFCAGGDLAAMHSAGLAEDHAAARHFWRDEYRMNRALHHFPKPVVSFLHGFTMGGGVGVGCHGTHRIVGESARIALPECAVGLVPDVGGTLHLARAPGRLGEYLGTTGDRMDAADAIHAGFANHHVPEAAWPALAETLARTGDCAAIHRAATAPGDSRLAGWQPDIDAVFDGETLGDIARAMPSDPPEAIARARRLMERNAPLAMAVAVDFIRRTRLHPTIETALDLEYRYTHRALAQGDFLEGIRAAVIDKDHAPRWTHRDWTRVPDSDVLNMTRALGQAALTFDPVETGTAQSTWHPRRG